MGDGVESIEPAIQAVVPPAGESLKANESIPSVSKDVIEPVVDFDTTIEKEGRHVIFGDISIVENTENKIPDQEFEQLQEDFELFKTLVNNASTPDEQAFLSSRLVFRSVMGLEPESGFFSNEARVLYQALDRADALDKFGVFISGKYAMDISFLHLRGAEKVLLNYQQELGVKVPEEEMTKTQVSETVASLFNQPDAVKRHKAIGLLSGFPKGPVEWWLEKHKSTLNEFPLRPIDARARQYLEAKNPTLEPERVKEVYTRPYLRIGDVEQKQPGDENGISGLGTDFKTTYPPSSEVTEYCQRLLEIDRRLGVTQFVSETRGLINARQSIKEIPKQTIQ